MGNKRDKLLVVDDIMINRAILNGLFSEQFEVLEAENGRKALDIIAENQDELAIVLLDLVMPVLDGFGVLQEMNRSGLIQTVPVILITGESDDEKALLGYGLGASDLVSKPFNPDVICRRVNNVVDLYSYKNNLEEKVAEQTEVLEKQAQRIKQSNLFMIDALSTTVEFRNLESGEHVKRIRSLTRIMLDGLADAYHLTPEEIDSISNASALHDIGKITIPDAVLLKPGPLTKEEFEVMKTHTTRGCDILDTLSYTQDPVFFNYCYEICRHHHECWDGRGYPDGLKGDEISIWAQAASLADVYDALTSKRCYKDAVSHDHAVEMIVRGECGTFNPKMLEVFQEVKSTLLDKMRELNAKEMSVYEADEIPAAVSAQ